MSQTDKWQQAFRDAYEGIPTPTESTDGWAAVSGTVARRAVRRRVALISVAVIPVLCVGIAGLGFFFRPAVSVSDPSSTLAVVSSSTQLSPSAPSPQSSVADASSSTVAMPSSAVADASSSTTAQTSSSSTSSSPSASLPQSSDADQSSSAASSLTATMLSSAVADASSPATALPQSMDMDQEKPQMKDLKENSQRLLERSKSAPSASGENRQLLASVDLNFNGMPGGSGKLADAPMPMGTASPFTSDIRLFQASAKDLYSDATFRHHLPIGAGVNVSFALPHSLSLTSGVHYTLLWSQMQASGVSGYKNQYVHYIGVPLQLDWNFFDRAGFTLRTGLGARMDICVKAVLDGQKMDEKPLQWTTVASLAASYNITPRISIYLQPELDWFITDTSLKTIRGRSPVNATFRAGLQFNLFAR